MDWRVLPAPAGMRNGWPGSSGLREAVGYRQEPSEHTLREPYLVAVRPRLTEAGWDAVWAEGRRLGPVATASGIIQVLSW